MCIKRVLIIDDDASQNTINTLILRKSFKDVELDVLHFTNAKEGLSYIIDNYNETSVATILFVDVNMPLISGWDVVEAFEKLPCGIQKCFSLYLLSSSLNPVEKQKASCYKSVKAFLSKPLFQHLEVIKAEMFSAI